MALPAVFVTGGNGGIGAAICKQLVLDHGCRVFLGSRSVERGQNAIKDMALGDKEGNISVVQCDVQSDDSVKDAAAKVKNALGDEKLYGLVNNAGAGIEHGVTDDVVINTNFYGPKRVCDNFMTMMDQKSGRIVNVGSGAGPAFVDKISDVAVKKQMCSASTTWAELEFLMKRCLDGENFGFAHKLLGYGLSKAGLAVYTMQLAAQYPKIKVSCLSPGHIQTNITKGVPDPDLLPPEKGTVSTMKCLFDELPGNGFYYGSDGLRSPLHFMREPDAPEYDGKPPVFE